jgi:nitroreductase
MADLDDVIRSRRSVRGFLPDRPVPRQLLLEACALAQHAPSNCNVQPWRVFLASGARRDRLVRALAQAIEQRERPLPEDPIDSFFGPYQRLQFACAAELYGKMGVARGDVAARKRAMLLNYRLFEAPHVAVVCMAREFQRGVALDVGIWLQTFMLALWSRGVATCAQASLRNYPQVIRAELLIPDGLTILCGVSIGYEDPAVPANETRQGREPVEHNVVFLDE